MKNISLYTLKISTSLCLNILKPTVQLDRLIRSGVRFSEQLTVINAPAAWRIVTNLVFWKLWDAMDLNAVYAFVGPALRCYAS